MPGSGIDATAQGRSLRQARLHRPGSCHATWKQRGVTSDQFATLPPQHVVEDLLVTSLSVQGGEAIIAGKSTFYARIVMSGVRLENMKLPEAARPTRQAAVLDIEVAEQLAVGLREFMNNWARSSPTPVLPARGVWSWTSDTPPGDDILVTEASAGGHEIRAAGRTTPIIRLDFKGKLLKASSSDTPPVQMPGAVFTVPRHVQSLIGSLKKCTQALRPRTDPKYLGFAIPSLEPSSFGSQGLSWPQE